VRPGQQDGVDAWFSIPWTADDDYVRQFARTVKPLLDPKLKAYVEYPTRSGTPSTRRASTRRSRARRWSWATGSVRGKRRHVPRPRSTEIMKICEQELPAERLVRVLAWQTTPVVREYPAEDRRRRQHHDVLAIAPYFGGYLATRAIRLTCRRRRWRWTR